MKKALSMLLAIITLVSITVLPASAETEAVHNDIDVIVHNQELSEETKAIIVAYYTHPELQDEEATTYNMTCNIIGHKFEYSTTTTITHKVRTTSPRCLRKMYDHGVCKRCGEQEVTLLSSTYIVCCA